METASDKQASDIVMLDIHELTTIADYFVVCTAGNERQLKAIVDAIDETLKKAGVSALHAEGVGESGWVLMDYGSVIAHIFAPAEREYYRLERLWSSATPVLRVQ